MSKENLIGMWIGIGLFVIATGLLTLDAGKGYEIPAFGLGAIVGATFMWIDCREGR